MDRYIFIATFLVLVLNITPGNSVSWTARSNTTKYWISNATGNYTFALQSCVDVNATLAILSDNDEYSFVMELLRANTTADSRTSYFLYATRSNSNEPYRWGDGSRFPGAARWGPNQPSDSNGINNEDCISLRFGTDKYFIFDDPCSQVNYSFICQRKIEYSWSGWGAWSACSASCTTGTRNRTRNCERTGTNGDNTCSPSDGVQSEACNIHLCNETITLMANCNATCNESGFIQQTLSCKYNQTFPEECRKLSFLPCQKNCSITKNSTHNGNVRNSSNRSTLNPSTQTVGYNPTTMTPSTFRETKDTKTTTATTETTTNKIALTTTATDTAIQDAPQPFEINLEILIAICVGIAVFLVLVLVFYCILSRKTKRKDSMGNMRELPAAPADHLYASASFHRVRSSRSNFYSNTTMNNQVATNETNDVEILPLNSQEESNEGTYVTLNHPDGSEIQTENEVKTSEITSEKQSITSDYIAFDALESGCSFTQDSPKRSISPESVSRSSQTSRRSEPKTLEFDYVSVDNLKTDEEKYSKLKTSPTETRQWCDTYDVIVR